MAGLGIIIFNVASVIFGTYTLHKIADRDIPSQVSQSGNSPPRLFKTTVMFTVSESAPIGTVIGHVTAMDPDGDSISFSTDDAPGVFLINSVSGAISTSTMLDREFQDQYVFKIYVQDNGSPPLMSILNCLINVLDVNDNGPQFDQPEYKVSVNSDSTMNTVLLVLKVTDLDMQPNNIVTVSIPDPPDNFPFVLDTTSHRLIVTADLENASLPNRFETFIRATDSGNPSMSNEVALIIEMVFINKPNSRLLEFVFPSWHVMIREEALIGTVITRVAVVERGVDGTVMYYLEPTGPDFPFDIESATGVIRLNRSLDREVRDTYEFTVEARNTAMQNSALSRVTIQVIDINDNSPVFQSSVYTQTISPNLPVGTLILRVRAFDPDVGVNAEILYSIHVDDGQDEPPFLVNADTGEIVVDGSLSSGTFYNFQVLAQDKGVPSLGSSAQVEINIS